MAAARTREGRRDDHIEQARFGCLAASGTHGARALADPAPRHDDRCRRVAGRGRRDPHRQGYHDRDGTQDRRVSDLAAATPGPYQGPHARRRRLDRNPRTGTWRLLPAFDHLIFFGGPNGAVWNGHEAFLAGTLSLCPERGSACDQRGPIFVAFNPVTDKIREIKLPAYSADFGADTASSLKPIAWTGSEVVFSAAVPGSVRVFGYDPTTGAWKKGRVAPCYLGMSYTQTAWVGNRFVAACGVSGLQIYNPVTDNWTWRTITPGPSPLNSRESSAVVWTGTDLIAWSGSVYKPFNPTPGDGASLTLKR
jgi:hypothetical protein